MHELPGPAQVIPGWGQLETVGEPGV
jgi:hypothetical protein